jgi:hypothetical protein
VPTPPQPPPILPFLFRRGVVERDTSILAICNKHKCLCFMLMLVVTHEYFICDLYSLHWSFLKESRFHNFFPELTPRVVIRNKENNKLRGFSPQANYTDQATAACRQS